MRRVTNPPNHAPKRQPTTAPIAEEHAVYAFAEGSAPATSLSAHNGNHWTEPHVPISATDDNMIAIKVCLIRAGEKISVSGRIFVVLALTAACHFSDFGTKIRMM